MTKLVKIGLVIAFALGLSSNLFASNVKVETSFLDTIDNAYVNNSLQQLSNIENKAAYGLKYTTYTVNELENYGSINEESSDLISLAADSEINAGYGYQCVGLVKAVGINFSGGTSTWVRGRNIVDRTPRKGYVIATFDSNGNYDFGHVAIVLATYDDHIIVIDQNWDGTGSNPVGQIYIHSIDFSGTGVSNATNYYIVRYP